MKKFCRYIVLSFITSFLPADAEFEATAPVDQKDEARYGFGSLIKDKGSLLSGVFSKSSSNESNKEPVNTIKVEKKKEDKTVSKKEKLWNSAMEILRDFPIELADKKNGKIETDYVKVPEYDSTGVCLYKVSVQIIDDSNVLIKVDSAEDSHARIVKITESIKKKILDI